jgi:hypothetical protein
MTLETCSYNEVYMKPQYKTLSHYIILRSSTLLTVSIFSHFLINLTRTYGFITLGCLKNKENQQYLCIYSTNLTSQSQISDSHTFKDHFFWFQT